MTYAVREAAFDANGLVLQGPTSFGALVTLASGQAYPAGAVLGQITTGGKYTLSLAAASDGSQEPVAVLPDAVDASGADKTAFVFFAAGLAEDKLVFGDGHTAAALRRRLAQRGLFVYARQPA